MLLDSREINTGTVATDENCRGCNKCVAVCPAFGASAAAHINGMNRMYVDQQNCLLCGRCLIACSHGARLYTDDLSRLLADLEAFRNGHRKRPISVVVDPAFEINYPEKYTYVLGWLKSLGVQHVFSAATGADIMVWAYIKYFERTGARGMISQHCPAVVEYVKRFRPDLLCKLMPVMSPLMCTAVYLRKYLHLELDLAFISPCVAHSDELLSPEVRSYVQYNVTLERLMEAAGEANPELYPPAEYEGEYGLGALLSANGGLRENMEHYLGLGLDNYVGHPEGESHAFAYLDRRGSGGFEPMLTELCGCESGCNHGPATGAKRDGESLVHLYEGNARLSRIRAMNDDPHDAPEARLAALNKRFAAMAPEDFSVEFAEHPAQRERIGKSELEESYQALLKHTREERSMDCTACGYGSCQTMAKAIALGINHIDNCANYTRKRLGVERSQLSMLKRRMEQIDTDAPERNASGVDPLTGIATRYGFERYMENALKRARSTGLSGYVFSIDLDDFMTINESYGHNFGNAMLVEFARFLKENLGGLCEVFRADGDEFMMVAEGVDAQTAKYIGDVIIQRGQSVWKIMGARIYCTVSVGVVLFPESGDGVSNIVKNVELAMHAAKEQGKNRCVAYLPEMSRDTQSQTYLTRSMREAISNDFDRFDVYYQPWVTCEGDVVGAEALLRWRDERGQVVNPSEFIDVAELSGLIVTLDEFVLRHAMEKAGELQRLHPGFMMSVNFSARQFLRPDVCKATLEIIDSAGVGRENVILEITEAPDVENMDRYTDAFRAFSAAGVKIALDDFGTGYSSLSYLSGLPIDLVKINRSFIHSVETDGHIKYLLTTTVDLMHKMGRRVCVKGVETRSQLDFCEGVGADIVQGFLFFSPMPGAQLTQLISIG